MADGINKASPSVDFPARSLNAGFLSIRNLMVAPSVPYSTMGDIPVTMYTSVLRSLHLMIKVGVSVLFGQPLIDDSASRLRIAVFESSILEDSVENLHFELDKVTLVVVGAACLAARESKHASLDTELLSFEQAAISEIISCAEPLAALSANIRENNFFMCC